MPLSRGHTRRHCTRWVRCPPPPRPKQSGPECRWPREPEIGLARGLRGAPPAPLTRRSPNRSKRLPWGLTLKAAPTGDQLVLTLRARIPAWRRPWPAHRGGRAAALAPKPPSLPTHSILSPDQSLPPTRDPCPGALARSAGSAFPRQRPTPPHVTAPLPGLGVASGRGHVDVQRARASLPFLLRRRRGLPPPVSRVRKG